MHPPSARMHSVHEWVRASCMCRRFTGAVTVDMLDVVLPTSYSHLLLATSRFPLATSHFPLAVCCLLLATCLHAYFRPPTGTVTLDTYEVGRALLDIGVISAGDMTTEAIVTKMAYLVGRKLSPREVSVQMLPTFSHRACPPLLLAARASGGGRHAGGLAR